MNLVFLLCRATDMPTVSLLSLLRYVSRLRGALGGFLGASLRGPMRSLSNLASLPCSSNQIRPRVRLYHPRHVVSPANVSSRLDASTRSIPVLRRGRPTLFELKKLCRTHWNRPESTAASRCRRCAWPAMSAALRTLSHGFWRLPTSCSIPVHRTESTPQWLQYFVWRLSNRDLAPCYLCDRHVIEQV